MSIVGAIITLSQVVAEAEKLKGYYDETGLDMHIAVKKNGRLAVSTKHWGRVHYIVTDKDPKEIWTSVKEVASDIGRNLIKSEKGPYVYINKLSVTQTQEVFDKFKEKLGDNIERHFQFSWKIDDAVLDICN